MRCWRRRDKKLTSEDTIEAELLLDVGLLLGDIGRSINSSHVEQ